MAIDKIQIRGLAKRYGMHRALAGVDLDLHGGQPCALLGPNGAGKSTLLGIVSSLVRPTAGEVRFFEGEEEVPSGASLRAQIGVLGHESFLYDGLTGIENLQFWGRLYGVEDIGTQAKLLLDEVGLEEKAWTRPAGTYSRGMVQRLALARTMLHRPAVLLLDEPFTGIDRTGCESLVSALRRFVDEGCVVLIITHDLESVANLCSHIALLRSGKLVHEVRKGEVEGKQNFDFVGLRELYAEHSRPKPKDSQQKGRG